MIKTAAPGIPLLLKEIQTRLNDMCKRRGFRLQVPKDGYRVDEDWLVVVVNPDKGGVRAYDYAEILSAVEEKLRASSVVEKQLRASGLEHILLVPTFAN